MYTQLNESEAIFRTKCIEAKVDQNFIDGLWRELKDGVRVKEARLLINANNAMSISASSQSLLLTDEEAIPH